MRQYAMTRLDPGDYLCPSNDATRLWRFRRYYEDGSLEEVFMNQTVRKIVGWFWEAMSIPMPTPEQMQLAVIDDNIDGLDWQIEESLLRSRREAIATMERREVAPR